MEEALMEASTSMTCSLKNNITITPFVTALILACVVCAAGVAGAANTAPTITPVPDTDAITINPADGAAFSIGIIAEDIDGDNLTYSWKLDGNLLGEDGPTLDSASFVGGLASGNDYVLEVSVTDGIDIDYNRWTLQMSYPPVALDDMAVTLPEVPVDIDVLANDSDQDTGDTLTIVSVTQPGNGTAVEIEGNTKIRYTPDANFSEEDEFDYTITDGRGGSAWATVTVYEQSACPWVVMADPNYQYTYPIYGTALMSGAHIADGDWVGVFDGVGNCYGAGQYRYGQNKAYTLSAYAASAAHKIDGFESGELMYFRIRRSGTLEDIPAIPVTNDGAGQAIAPQRYPVFQDGEMFYKGDPVKINLVTADRKAITLKDGWNFISFNIMPYSTKIGDVFRSLVGAGYLEYVADHEKFWWKTTQDGSLTDVYEYNSYSVFIKLPSGTGSYTLEIEGIEVGLPYTFNLVTGWNNISYLYDVEALALDNMGSGQESGIFDGLAQNIVWIKGPGGSWTMPGYGELRLKPGDGLFMKTKSAATFTYEVQGG